MSIYRILILAFLVALGGPAAAQERLKYQDWELVLEEEFDSYESIVDMAQRSVWQFRPDHSRNLVGNKQEVQYYDSTAVSLRRGKLVFTAEPLPQPLQYHFQANGRDTVKLLHYKSGWISLRKDYWTALHLGDSTHWVNSRGIGYGLFEIRCRLAPGSATWPAFWLHSGPTEIDVFEGYDERIFEKRSYANNIHYNPSVAAQARNSQRFFRQERTADLSQSFNTFTVAWEPEEVRFYLNRRLVRTIRAAEVPTYGFPAVIIANLAVLDYPGHQNWPVTAAGPRTSMAIDYIKVYKPRDGRWRSGRNLYATPPALPKKRR